MTDDFKVGDTVYGVKNVYIQNFDDDYYEIPIPVSIFKSTVKEYQEDSRDSKTIKLADDCYYWSDLEGKVKLWHTRQQALEALKEKRKSFLKEYPNNWRKIIKVLNELLEEQGK